MPNCRQRIEQIGERAIENGLGNVFADLLTEIRHQLETRPREWGDPNFRFHGLKAVSHMRLQDGFRIRYAVHESIPVVFLLDIEPMGSHPST